MVFAATNTTSPLNIACPQPEGWGEWEVERRRQLEEIAQPAEKSTTLRELSLPSFHH